MAVDAVVFDLDGVLVQSEEVWDEERRDLVREAGGRWYSLVWSRYLHDRLDVPLAPGEINARALERVERRYREALPCGRAPLSSASPTPVSA